MPADGSTVPSRRLPVTGWVVADGSTVRGVVVLLDGVTVGGAPAEKARPDVAASLGLPEACTVGFSCVVDLTAAAPANGKPSQVGTLAVAALLEDGTLSPVFARSTVALGA